jgi:hypothetical protein
MREILTIIGQAILYGMGIILAYFLLFGTIIAFFKYTDMFFKYIEPILIPIIKNIYNSI